MDKPKAKRPRYEPIGLTLHAVIDWALVVLTIVAPVGLGYLTHLPQAAYTFAAGGLLGFVVVVTDYPGGVVKRLGMLWHQLIEVVSFPVFIVGPWALFGNHPASWLLSTVGFALLVNTLSTRKIRARH